MMAARNRTSFRVEVGQKGIEHSGVMGSIRDKAVLTEIRSERTAAGRSGPRPRGNYGLPYEPFRIFSALPVVAMTGPSAAFLSHTGNANEVSVGRRYRD